MATLTVPLKNMCVTPRHMLRGSTKQRLGNNKRAAPHVIDTKCFAKWGLPGLFKRKAPNPMREPTDELYNLLVFATPTTRREAKEWNSRVRSLVDELVQAGGVYDESCMDGRWQVVHTQGPLLWKQFWDPLRSSRTANRSFQDFDLEAGTVMNSSELRGESVVVSAGGSFEPEDESQDLPKRFIAFIEEGGITFGERIFGLPIQGEGYFDVVYMDPQVPLRIFRGSNGSLAVQVPESVLCAATTLSDANTE
mmetsp:Transcript_28608/g.62637  ORF Transcript_28608/g.62637 Transcript_28608/m.62637 type:complete len:251 (-) Transcript_28608:49-801(-)|eukprot:CAMPEP_0118926428 /NCGR_PEP_ID=MMETSP1169-20130426/4111_1 /TAXON_ID=36882 /ORGANISM="Pyramimonas obovata, Strain CCMP722" /LENGTH=250 /DNA_ID=CAMNT_0006867969 /DNA_START=74 /DNA_END=826 /DNA_ORIENTATION=+